MTEVVCVCVCSQSSRIISISAWWVFEDPTGLPELLLLGDWRWWLIKFLNGLKSILYLAWILALPPEIIFCSRLEGDLGVPANFLLVLSIGDPLLFGHGNLQLTWQLAVVTTKHCFVTHWVMHSSLGVPRNPISHGCTTRQFRHAQVWTQGLRR